jgi:hypothetical protein
MPDDVSVAARGAGFFSVCSEDRLVFWCANLAGYLGALFVWICWHLQIGAAIPGALVATCGRYHRIAVYRWPENLTQPGSNMG